MSKSRLTPFSNAGFSMDTPALRKELQRKGGGVVLQVYSKKIKTGRILNQSSLDKPPKRTTQQPPQESKS